MGRPRKPIDGLWIGQTDFYERSAARVRLRRDGPTQRNDRLLLSDGRRDGKGLAPKTVRNVHALLHRALKDAARWGYVPYNRADDVDPPHGTSPERQVWSPEQLRAFLTHVRDDRLYALWILVATTGMRRAELAGLRWSDIDFPRARLTPRLPRVAVNYAACSPMSPARPTERSPRAARSAWPTPAVHDSPPPPNATTPRRLLERPASEPRRGGDGHGWRRPPGRLTVPGVGTCRRQAEPAPTPTTRRKEHAWAATPP